MSNSAKKKWKHRLNNFGMALSQLDEACAKEEYSNLERAGLVHTFGFSFEMSWNTLKALLYYEGIDLKIPRDIIKTSFKLGYINAEDCEVLLEALMQRNVLSHNYNEGESLEAVHLIKEVYHPTLQRLFIALNERD